MFSHPKLRSAAKNRKTSFTPKSRSRESRHEERDQGPCATPLIRACGSDRQAPMSQEQRAMEDYFQAVEVTQQVIAGDPAFFSHICRLAEAHDELYFKGAIASPSRRSWRMLQ